MDSRRTLWWGLAFSLGGFVWGYLLVGAGLAALVLAGLFWIVAPLLIGRVGFQRPVLIAVAANLCVPIGLAVSALLHAWDSNSLLAELVYILVFFAMGAVYFAQFARLTAKPSHTVVP